MDIRDFLANEKDTEKYNIFDSKIKKVKTLKEQRELELKYCKPDKQSLFIQDNKSFNSLQDMTIKLVFDDAHYKDLFFKYFNVLTYIENNVKDLELLYKILDMLENGEIKWQKKKKK